MSLEKGIDRIGTVISVASGMLLGSFMCFDSYRAFGGFHNPDNVGIVLVASTAIGLVVFLVVYFAIKWIFKLVNWVIEGFREESNKTL